MLKGTNFMTRSLPLFLLFTLNTHFVYIANPRIKCVTEPNIIYFLLNINLHLSFSTWLTHFTLRFLYILVCSGPRCATQFAAAATRWRHQCAVPKSLSANFVSRLAKVQSNKGPWVYNFNWETSPGVVGRRKTQWTKSRDFCKQYKHIFFSN